MIIWRFWCFFFCFLSLATTRHRMAVAMCCLWRMMTIGFTSLTSLISSIVSSSSQRSPISNISNLLFCKSQKQPSLDVQLAPTLGKKQNRKRHQQLIESNFCIFYVLFLLAPVLISPQFARRVARFASVVASLSSNLLATDDDNDDSDGDDSDSDSVEEDDSDDIDEQKSSVTHQSTATTKSSNIGLTTPITSAKVNNKASKLVDTVGTIFFNYYLFG